MRSPDSLPSPLLLVAPRPDAAQALRRRLAGQPAAVARDWIDRGLATYALARLPDLGIDPAPVRSSLARAALVELGWTAKRKAALGELNAMATDGLSRLLFKGAATSILFYPQETWRWSGDIDVMMHEADLERLYPSAMADLRARLREIPFPEHHIPRQTMAGTAVELHHRLEFAPIWGTLPDLLPGARPCPGFPNLLVPDSETSFTLALLHLLKHRIGMPFDILDLARIEATGLDWERMSSSWRRTGIAPYAVAALAAAHETTGIAPAETIVRLWESLRGREARRAAFLRCGILANRLSWIGQYRFECLVTGIPFARFCLRTFLGTRTATARLTGRSPRDPRFWLAHCLVLPSRRAWRLATGRHSPSAGAGESANRHRRRGA